MGVKKYKPTSPGRRHGSVLDFAEITARKPEKSLTEPLHKTGGRNNHGRVTARRRGGGHKRKYRIIDWKRNKDGIRVNLVAPGVVRTPLHEATEVDAFGEVALLNRVGEAHEIAEAVLYLATAQFTTGHLLNVDGGFVTGRA